MASHLLLQLSDIHLRAGGGPLNNGADTAGNLERALGQIAASGTRPEAILLTGDLADAGEPAAYEALRAQMDEMAQQLGAEIVYVPGNHDDRAVMRTYLLGAGASDDPLLQVHHFGGLRVITLDSVIPGKDAGALEASTLRWLASELAQPAADGTIVALHHPPVPSPIKTMSGIALAHPEQLASVVEGTDVSLIVSGHDHHATSGLLAGIPVFVAPALAYRAEALIEDVFVPQRSSAFARIDIIGGQPLVTTIQVDSRLDQGGDAPLVEPFGGTRD